LKARHIQKTIGRPSIKDFLKIVAKGIIQKCQLNNSDKFATKNIFGPEVGNIKGKL